ncbi:MAG TPA: hypothetical protein VMI54_18840 [Polyangiaceae bacterium]|nr:hypothetical protein [Polyangiaceae bacterium]
MQVLGFLGRWAALSLSVVSMACSVEVDPEHAPSNTGTTRAVIAVTRSAPASAPDEARADAFAGFLRTPAGSDAKSALALAGLRVDLPANGECRKGAVREGATSGLTAVELLDAGEVTVAAGGTLTTLAPRAFPTITDTISGVVYTTRDRAAAPLPAATSYTVTASGGSSLEALAGFGQAPASLTGVEVAGEPFGGVDTIAAGQALALAWTPGVAGDRVYVELDGDSEPIFCSFTDESGRGTLPASVLPQKGSGVLSVHRLREAAFSDAGIAQGALRFDFELSASVTFE